MDGITLSKDQIELFRRRGYDVRFNANGTVQGFDTMPRPSTALEAAIESSLLEPWHKGVADAYLTYQHAFRSALDARPARIYGIVPGARTEKGEHARMVYRGMIRMIPPKQINRIDWGIYHPAQEPLAAYAEAFEHLDRAMRYWQNILREPAEYACAAH